MTARDCDALFVASLPLPREMRDLFADSMARLRDLGLVDEDGKITDLGADRLEERSRDAWPEPVSFRVNRGRP